MTELMLWLPSLQAADTVRGDALWAMYYLIEVDSAGILKAASVLEKSGSKDAETNLSLAILYLNLCMREWNSEYAKKGDKYIQKVKSYPLFPELHSIYTGISYSFQGRIKTILGMGDLKKAEDYMLKIPADYENWIIRFLRGVNLTRMGKGLPNIFFLKEAKQRALDLGRSDLLFVIEKFKQTPVDALVWETYDRAAMAVPAIVSATAFRELEP